MPRHIRGLDALRGLAVAAVLAFHANFAGFSGGFLGVSLFFTISGFLITSLVLREVVHGDLDLRSFWARRARRLLPAACAAVALVVLAAALGVFDLHKAATDGIFALGYGANWHQLASGQSYANLFSDPSPLLHFWSLAIEEQYYLLFPLLCWWCAKRRHPRAALAIALVGVLAISGHAHFEAWNTNRMYYGTDVRIGEIALGALLALVVERWRVLDAPPPWLRRSVAYLQLPVLVLVIWVVATTHETSRWLYHGGLLAMALCWTLFVLAAALEAGLIGRLGDARWLVGLGVISYGVYLVHWPLLLAVKPFESGTANAVLALGLSVLIAAASYRFFERPIRVNAITSHLRRGLVRVGAAVAGVVAVLALFTPALAPAGAARSFGAAPGTSRSHGATTDALRVLVIGDSTGGVLGDALVKYADAHPGIDAANEAMNGCPLSDARAQNMVRQQIWTAVTAACRHCAARLAADRSFDPDIVLGVFGPTQVADLKLGDHGPASNVTHPDVQNAARAEAAALRSEFPKARFVWMTAPNTFTGNRAIPEGDWLINDPTRVAAWNRLVGEFAAAPGGSSLDLAAHVASAPGGLRDRTWRPDGAHLRGAALAETTEWTVENLQHLVTSR
jgi:peptidoglycan/LPS O-acetylase OafA/YrhL